MIRAVLDADVLYPLPLRDTLLSAAHEGCFQPVWSAEILDEMIRNLLADGRIKPAGAIALRRDLDKHFEEALTHAPSLACSASLLRSLSPHGWPRND